jgi:restriction system protein
MSQKRGFVSSIAARERAAKQVARERLRALREIERWQRERDRERLANEKERLRLFHLHNEEEAESHNRDLNKSVGELVNLLREVLGLDCRLDFNALKTPLQIPRFDPGALDRAEDAPRPENYRPKPMGLLARLLPRSKARYQVSLRQSRVRFDADLAAHREREKTRETALKAARQAHQEQALQIREKTARQHAAIDALKSDYQSGQRSGVQHYCEAVLSHQSNPNGWTDSFRIAFMPESKQLVVEYDLPAFDIIPEPAVYQYIKSKQTIIVKRRSESDRRRLYASVIAQGSLRVLFVLFNADYAGHIDSIAFNGHVHAINRATGHEEHPCLLTLRTTRALFLSLDLARVDPETCLKGLSATVSNRPSELAPVRPVLEFNMADPRFVQEEEVLAGLDSRTNLMDLSPKEFEMLITNLFTKMGLESRQTRPSRDGGVDVWLTILGRSSVARW